MSFTKLKHTLRNSQQQSQADWRRPRRYRIGMVVGDGYGGEWPRKHSRDTAVVFCSSHMRRALRDFVDNARDADVAAGHGVEVVVGVNYLIPVVDVYDETLSYGTNAAFRPEFRFKVQKYAANVVALKVKATKPTS
jgi:hypothetical protein